MIDRILAFFENKAEVVEVLSVDEAAAVMLIEVMMADHEVDARERAVIRDILMRRTGGTKVEVDNLIDTATSHQQESVDLFQFTHVLNENWEEQERYELVVDLWRVAFADEDLDMYEDQRIRRVNDLLHLHHSHFIKAKSEAQQLP